MMTGLDLSAGATLGIVGYGRIGRAVARRARGFDLRLLATPHPRAAGRRRTAAGVTFLRARPSCSPSADVVSLHVPAHRRPPAT